MAFSRGARSGVVMERPSLSSCVKKAVSVREGLLDLHLVRFCEPMGVPALKSAAISARSIVVQE